MSSWLKPILPLDDGVDGDKSSMSASLLRVLISNGQLNNIVFPLNSIRKVVGRAPGRSKHSIFISIVKKEPEQEGRKNRVDVFVS